MIQKATQWIIWKKKKTNIKITTQRTKHSITKTQSGKIPPSKHNVSLFPTPEITDVLGDPAKTAREQYEGSVYMSLLMPVDKQEEEPTFFFFFVNSQEVRIRTEPSLSVKKSSYSSKMEDGTFTRHGLHIHARACYVGLVWFIWDRFKINRFSKKTNGSDLICSS